MPFQANFALSQTARQTLGLNHILFCSLFPIVAYSFPSFLNEYYVFSQLQNKMNITSIFELYNLVLSATRISSIQFHTSLNGQQCDCDDDRAPRSSGSPCGAGRFRMTQRPSADAENNWLMSFKNPCCLRAIFVRSFVRSFTQKHLAYGALIETY